MVNNNSLIDSINKKQIWDIIRPVEDLIKQTQELRANCKEDLDSIKEKICEASSQILFDEEEHRYFYNDEECIAVSHVVDMFIQETDFDLVAQNYVKKNNLRESWQRIRQIWSLKGEFATTNGTFVHQYGEDLTNICNNDLDNLGLKEFSLINGYYYPLSPKQVAVYKYFEYCLANKEIPFLAEIKLVLKNHAISGTFDQLVYNTKNNSFVIRDYKTNSELTKDFKKPMKHPFELYNDEALSHYIIQQNIYSLMLQEIGINVSKMELVWLKDNENFELISLPKMEKDVLKAIEGLY